MTIRGWVAQAPAGRLVRLAQAVVVAWAASSVLVQLIPGPSPPPMTIGTAIAFVLQWLIVTLWIPVGVLVWGRRRSGFIFAALLLGYSLVYQVSVDWAAWLGDPELFPGARRTLKLALTVAAATMCLFVAPRQPD